MIFESESRQVFPSAPRSLDVWIGLETRGGFAPKARSFASAFACVSALTLGTAPAWAQAENQAAARALFDDGRALVKSGNAAEACPKFEGAMHLYPSGGIALNLADCYEKLGRTASAWTEFGEAASLADRTNRPDDAAEARRRQTALEGKLTRLVIHVPRTIAGLSITRDGAELPAAAWDLPIPVDPGSHEIRAEAPGRAPWIQSVSASGPGQTTSVEVPTLVPVPPTAPPRVEPAQTSSATTPTIPPSGEAGGSSGGRIAGWVLVGSGVALGIAGGALWGVGLNNAYQARNSGETSLPSSAVTLYDIGIGGVIVGGLAAAGGVILVLTSHGEAHGMSLNVSPWVGGAAGGVRVGGTW
jgi:hypothetical protein